MKKKLANSFTARLGVAGAIASATLFGLTAHAQDSRLSLADRVARLEQQAQTNQGNVGVVNQVSDLQQQVQQLQGQIEELQHQNKQLQDTNKAQYVDLDSRIGRLEGGGAAAGSGNAPAASTSTNPPASAPPAAAAAAPAPAAAAAPGKGTAPAPADSAAAQASYDAAFKALRAGDYASASRGFRGFLQQYPDSPLAPNAYYWLGESYYVTMNYPVAIEAFQRLVSQFPQSEKVPDGLLKIGYCQYELKQKDAAMATLKSVSAKYPGSKAAGLAQERLRRLQQQPSN
jgi:tol-pal system protein YbgF